jgi:threonine synthase
MPETWPQLDFRRIKGKPGLTYATLAGSILALYAGQPDWYPVIDRVTKEAYAKFSDPRVAPLREIGPNRWIMELFHGPTLAFKDVALQLLGQLFETFLSKRDAHLTIIGATSGDTGSAAIDGVAGRAKIDIFMLHPAGRVSDVQRRQMTTVFAPNVYNIAIDGSFDDAQAIVKALFNDRDFNGRFTLSAVNSINWARLMAQVVYYFYAAVRLGAPHRAVVRHPHRRAPPLRRQPHIEPPPAPRVAAASHPGSGSR